MIQLDIASFPKRQRLVLELLENEVAAGGVQIGESIGNELALAKRMDVSRNTIRCLIGTLERSGVIRTVPRRGVFLQSEFRLGAGSKKKAETEERNYYYFRWCDSLMESEISHHFECFAREHGIKLAVLNMKQKSSTLIELVDHLAPGDVLALMPTMMESISEALQRAIARKVRVLQLDRYLPELETPSLVFDHYSGAVQAVRYLFRKHNLPVWYYGFKHPISGELRYQAWHDCMIEYGYDPEEYIIPCEEDDTEAEQKPNTFYLERFQEFMAGSRQLPMAIFCMCDQLAQNVYAVAEERGLGIGKDIFPVGFDDIPAAARMNPPLSSLRADTAQLVQAAGELMLNWPETSDFCRILPVKLMERG